MLYTFQRWKWISLVWQVLFVALRIICAVVISMPYSLSLVPSNRVFTVCLYILNLCRIQFDTTYLWTSVSERYPGQKGRPERYVRVFVWYSPLLHMYVCVVCLFVCLLVAVYVFSVITYVCARNTVCVYTRVWVWMCWVYIENMQPYLTECWANTMDLAYVRTPAITCTHRVLGTVLCVHATCPLMHIDFPGYLCIWTSNKYVCMCIRV